MRRAGWAALVAAVLVATATVGSTLVAAAEGVATPAPAAKKPAAQPPAQGGPSALQILPDPIANLIAPLKPGMAGMIDDKQRALVDKVSGYLSNVQTLVGDFVQVGPDGRRTEGQFFLQKPGKVRFAYNPPTPVDVVADGHSVVVRDRNLATQELYPLSQTPLRFLLSDHIDLLKDTSLISVSADDVFVTVVVEESHVLTGTSRLMLMFGAKDLQLRQWTVTDPQGFETTVAVYNLDTTKKPDPEMFRIKYPERPDPR